MVRVVPALKSFPAKLKSNGRVTLYVAPSPVLVEVPSGDPEILLKDEVVEVNT